MPRMGEFVKSEISSFLPFVVQASAQALTEYNLDNAHERKQIILTVGNITTSLSKGLP